MSWSSWPGWRTAMLGLTRWLSAGRYSTSFVLIAGLHRATFDDVTLRLSTSNLEVIERLGVTVPHYDRAALVPRIVHLGVGGFHRAHMALYTDELAEAGGDWGIRGVGLLDADRRMAGVLDSQEHLYTLIERDSDGSRLRIVGSIVDYAFVAGDPAAFAKQVAP